MTLFLWTFKVLGVFVAYIDGAHGGTSTNSNSINLYNNLSFRTRHSTVLTSSITSTSTSIVAFASPKNNKRKNKKKQNNKNVVGAGFGQSSQPKVEDLNYPDRIPPNAAEEPCPCGSTSDSDSSTDTGTGSNRLLYKDCCYPFHNKDKVPQSPIDVLKSRYSAFSWRMIPYILDTTHPISRDFKKDKIKWAKELNRDGMFDSYDFISLDIVKEEVLLDDNDENDNDDASNNTNTNTIEGFVEFKVNLKANKNSGHHIEGQEIVVSERSRFLQSTREGGWLYAGGDVKSSVGGEDIKLN